METNLTRAYKLGNKQTHSIHQNMLKMARDMCIQIPATTASFDFGPNQLPSRSTLHQQPQNSLPPAPQPMPAISADPPLSASLNMDMAQAPTASASFASPRTLAGSAKCPSCPTCPTCSAPSVSLPPPARLSAVQAAALPRAALRQNNANDVPQLIMDRTAGARS
jgi:hypothetical protein